ncbi:hypothetical protein MGG_16166 [Pyricularia oryzae 70-15]|uniref:Uncharacterized protein n=1 Tax=Pyricularia oryzae (strain 70-15 / ATCC MYA-4617 / FGSC 8958) TaxID=242507 RepID=G4MLP4_PYRO7|nr:uncharacterized protein MGG_16166 [Pyricularia oryzae 70-15]EHA56877.1 hypothetical protein MGG_16166 [Pyricularia oryzae 70-15]
MYLSHLWIEGNERRKVDEGQVRMSRYACLIERLIDDEYVLAKTFVSTVICVSFRREILD